MKSAVASGAARRVIRCLSGRSPRSSGSTATLAAVYTSSARASPQTSAGRGCFWSTSESPLRKNAHASVAEQVDEPSSGAPGREDEFLADDRFDSFAKRRARHALAKD